VIACSFYCSVFEYIFQYNHHPACAL
jgi:hypothetical protein